MKFAEMLKTIRQEKGLTQMQLASIIGVTDAAIRGWENQNKQPDFAMLCQLAKVLGVTVGQLLGVEDY